MPYRLTLALVGLLLAPLAAPAAGLGRLALFSMVGEPLNAEIEVVSLLPAERESLAAKIAPTDVYDRAHVAAVPRPDELRVAIERKADGREIVKVSSPQPLDKPLVNLLVELSWNGGGVIRQYSFLLDSVDRRGPAVATAPPPTEPSRAPVPAADPPAAKPATPAPEPTPVAARAGPSPDAAAVAKAPRPIAVAQAKPEPAQDRGAPSAARGAPTAAAGGTYAVQPGDSLLKIAQETRPEGVSTAQMMVAIFRANEDAFSGGSMDRLKGGRTLKLPDRDTAAAVSADEARQLVAAQRAPTDRSRAGAAPAAGASSDDAAALDRAIAENRDRAADLEKTVRDLKQLIEGQDRQIAELQKQLGGGKAPAQPARKTR